ncbi:MAG: hypothetical protein U0871_22335 [Gemmataceae bacterium]
MNTTTSVLARMLVEWPTLPGASAGDLANKLLALAGGLNHLDLEFVPSDERRARTGGVRCQVDGGPAVTISGVYHSLFRGVLAAISAAIAAARPAAVSPYEFAGRVRFLAPDGERVRLDLMLVNTASRQLIHFAKVMAGQPPTLSPEDTVDMSV